MIEYYVYLLLDTRKLDKPPFYVGKGKDDRAYSHFLNEGIDPHNPRKSYTIQAIRKVNLEPEIIFYASQLTDDRACDIETQLIKQYGRRGIDPGGILTNIAEGGHGGNTGPITTETRKKLSKAKKGTNNASAKLSEEDVIDIYISSDRTIRELAIQYIVSQKTIIDIKRGVYWSFLTQPLNIRHGFHFLNRWTFYTEEEKKQEIQEIFLADTSIAGLDKKHHLGYKKLVDIKTSKRFVEYTAGLKPGNIIKHKLTEQQRQKIRCSNKSNVELAKIYGVHQETIRNIKKSGWNRPSKISYK